jgi:hypothetical protein
MHNASRRLHEKKLYTDTDLLASQTWMEEALEKFRGSGMGKIENMKATLSAIATARWQRYILFGTLPAEARLLPYRELEHIYIGIRRERSTLKG